MDSISKRIKRCRESLHLSPSYVANYLSIDIERFEKIESGEVQPTPIEISALAHLFHMPSSRLIYGDNPEIPIEIPVVINEHDYYEVLSLLQFKKMVKGDNNGKDYCV